MPLQSLTHYSHMANVRRRGPSRTLLKLMESHLYVHFNVGRRECSTSDRPITVFYTVVEHFTLKTYTRMSYDQISLLATNPGLRVVRTPLVSHPRVCHEFLLRHFTQTLDIGMCER